MPDSNPPPPALKAILDQCQGADDPTLTVCPADEPKRPRDLMLEELRDAAAEYHRQCRRVNEAFALAEAAEDDGAEMSTVRKHEAWANAVNTARWAAYHRLVRRILFAFGRVETSNPDERLPAHWRPCLFELDNVYYVVGPNPANEMEPILLVVDLPNDSDADWSEGDDE